ncbi:HAMP domain-containing histidine kinase [Ktedonosporobacter rubrisoli]|uniref:histidine kinase n=1 Tax=Ktedonosporobacter rubrisoli TaxID=2509675 RepID=A0A4P6JZ21_KTERU|nr:HAMP domain-containing sensor histidine kinase [Ktedonosporobacter rubrisoli]QBD80964.1 HAMP domain-containing histidine kinase [Ktedonosporobacter rubrisoli]
MRFSFKIFICIVVAVALSFATGGYMLISSNFTAARDREVSLAVDEHLSLQYVFESALVTQELQGQGLTDDTVRTAAQGIAIGLQLSGHGGRAIIVYNSRAKEIYPDAGKQAPDSTKMIGLRAGQVMYAFTHIGKTYTLFVTGLLVYGSEKMYLSYSQDISEIFAQRDAQIQTFIFYQGINILMSAVLAFLISWLLTRPVRQLTQISHRIAAGDYKRRVEIRTSDEIGELAQSFNLMAASVEEKINALEQSSHIKDDFIANFTHELKTPMTSIVGYADMLRSRQLNPETLFKAANYIYNEANRLEALSLKMLKLVVMERQDFTLAPVAAEELLRYILRAATPSFVGSDVTIKASAHKGWVAVEPDLMKTLLLNLMDNARKASSAGSIVELRGSHDGEQYTFTVTDHGRGIPQEELGRITEAFYMVDKSRSRVQNGAGLGLSIASKIATLHHTTLQFVSCPGVGTSVSISLPYCHAQEEYEDEA